jgi:hypothetical protein
MEYMNNNFDIKQFLDLSNYTTDTRLARRKDNKEGKPTAEFFTPYSIVKRMCDKVSDEQLGNS